MQSCGAQTQWIHLQHTPTCKAPTCYVSSAEEGSERLLEPEDREVCREMVSPSDIRKDLLQLILRGKVITVETRRQELEVAGRITQ